MSDTLPLSTPSLSHRVFFGPCELRAGWRFLLFLIGVIAMTSACNYLLRLLLQGSGQVVKFLAFEVEDILIFLLASYIMGRFEDRTIADYGLPWRRMFGAQFWGGMLLGFLSLTILLFAMRAAGVFHFAGTALHGADIVKWAVAYLIVFLLVALREEFRARGYALFTLSLGVGFWPAAILTSAFFAFSHRGNSGEDWIGLFNVGLFGLLACLLLRRTGNLWMPIGLHFSFDWAETYFYGVANSGQTLPGHFLNSTFSGPGWLSGGTVGPEGSVLCTLLIAALWLICARWLRAGGYQSDSGSSPK